MFEHFEGFNGQYHSDDYPDDEYIGSTSHSRKAVDHSHYHRKIFGDDVSVVHETDKCVLFKDGNGTFWCPKKLMKGYAKDRPLNNVLVWLHFRKQYVEEQKETMEKITVFTDLEVKCHYWIKHKIYYNYHGSEEVHEKIVSSLVLIDSKEFESYGVSYMGVEEYFNIAIKDIIDVVRVDNPFPDVKVY